MSSFETLAIQHPAEGIVLVELNRPDRLNALTFAMFEELSELCREVEADASARVLVLTGRGRGFCAGLDLEDAAKLAEMTIPQMLREQEGWARAITGFRHQPLPVIAAVNGAAAGAGMALALAADIRLASPKAKFNAAFVKIGLSGGDVGTSWMLPRIVGLGRAAEIMLTGKFVAAEAAERIGLVNEVVEEERLIEAAVALGTEIASNSPFGIRLTKQVLQSNIDAPSLEAALELENRNQTLTSQTEDMAEALGAFLEKRPPRFSGR
jgi:enoyl-CoA hydratase